MTHINSLPPPLCQLAPLVLFHTITIQFNNIPNAKHTIIAAVHPYSAVMKNPKKQKKKLTFFLEIGAKPLWSVQVIR